MKRNYLIFLQHLEDSINDIYDFMEGVNFEFFSANKEKQNAVIRSIEIIRESAKNLPEIFKSKYPKVEWKKIVGMRNKLIHHYFGVDLKTIWKVIKEDLPVLEKQIKEILAKERKK